MHTWPIPAHTCSVCVETFSLKMGYSSYPVESRGNNERNQVLCKYIMFQTPL